VSLVLAALLGLAGCVPDVATLQTRLEPHYRIQRPQGPGPFPAILLVPGCEGIAPSRSQTAGELVSHGYIVVFVDYLSARGLHTGCRDEVSPDDVGRDIRAVSTHVRSLSDVRARAVGAVGWSLGGSGVLASLVGAEWDRQPPLDAAVAFYPLCRGLRPLRTTVPTLLLLAGLDDIAPLAYCKDLIGRSAGRVQVHTFPEGFHAEVDRQAWSEVLEHFRVRLP
jgi:dienelactone hydrolase